MEELFRDFWWLLFPFFGMFMAIFGMLQSDRRARTVVELIKSYTDQGKEPPPELVRLAARRFDDDDGDDGFTHQHGRHSGAWSFVTFAALAAGFATGWWWVREESYAFAFVIVAVTMGVLAIGSLLILIFGRK